MQQLFEEAMNDFPDEPENDEGDAEGSQIMPISLGYNTWFIIIILPIWFYMFND